MKCFRNKCKVLKDLKSWIVSVGYKLSSLFLVFQMFQVSLVLESVACWFFKPGMRFELGSKHVSIKWSL
jgi:hypothetical protein